MIKKKILIASALLTTISYAAGGRYFAVIKNEAPNKYEMKVLTPSEESVYSPETIKKLSCTWGNCVGIYYSGQSFFIDGMSDPSNFVEMSGFTNGTRTFAFKNQMFVEDSGKIYGIGANDNGELGVNDTTRDLTTLKETVGLSGTVLDIQPGRSTVVRTTDGLYFAGLNSITSGVKLDQTKEELSNNLIFNKFVSSSNIDGVSIKYKGLAYVDGGKLFVAGANLNGRFGLGNAAINKVYTNYQEVQGLTGVTDVFIGGNNSLGKMFILKDGYLWVSGAYPTTMGIDMPIGEIAEFQNTGLQLSELKIYSDDATTYIIKDKKVYYSGSHPLSGEEGGVFSSTFKILDELKDYDFKDFISQVDILQILTIDGKIMTKYYDENWNDAFKIKTNPLFIG